MDERRDNLRQEVYSQLDKLPRKERRKLRSELDLQRRSSREKWRELLLTDGTEADREVA
jgi:hypothetical protein